MLPMLATVVAVLNLVALVTCTEFFEGLSGVFLMLYFGHRSFDDPAWAVAIEVRDVHFGRAFIGGRLTLLV